MTDDRLTLRSDDPLAAAAIQAIQTGDLATLRRSLSEHPGLATAALRRSAGNGGEATLTLLHVATDWPGHFPDARASVAALVAAGADVNARVVGPHTETPLHWAASSDDVAVLDTLLDAGADLEAPGAVIAGGTPLADAVAFGQWRAARRLVERGARTTLWQAAALGLVERVREELAAGPAPDEHDLRRAFWCACHGGQRETAQLLLERGATRDWIGYDHLTPLDAARRSGAGDLVAWLTAHGARSAAEVGGDGSP